jgi:hypothetical protein
LSHLPLCCEEVENKYETVLHREVEERMKKVVIRECNICQAKLIKTYGCNKMILYYIVYLQVHNLNTSFSIYIIALKEETFIQFVLVLPNIDFDFDFHL